MKLAFLAGVGSAIAAVALTAAALAPAQDAPPAPEPSAVTIELEAPAETPAAEAVPEPIPVEGELGPVYRCGLPKAGEYCWDGQSVIKTPANPTVRPWPPVTVPPVTCQEPGE